MPSLQFSRIRRIAETGEVWEVPLVPGLNLIVGDENTSKTTTLRIADFCLGDDDSAVGKFGRTIAQEYQAFELSIIIEGREYPLIRRPWASGQTRRIDAGGRTMDAGQFNLWISGLLGWPQIQIPRGLSLSAAQEVPLTFRTLYRHVYRKADSWTSFASQEFEYYRRAVVAFFLGVAEEVYRGAQVQITRQQQQIEELERRRIEIRSLLDEIVRQLTEGYEVSGTANLDTLGELSTRIESQASELRSRRDELNRAMQADPSYDAEKDERLAGLLAGIQQARHDLDGLSQVIEEQRRLVDSLEADARRIERARLSTAAFDTILVTACPACHQSIDSAREVTQDGQCYVCGKAVGTDVRQRRLELEYQTVQQERSELVRVLADLEGRRAAMEQALEQWSADRDRLYREVEEGRRIRVTPLLHQFEQIQYALGTLEQQRESLSRLALQRERLSDLDRQRAAVEDRLAALRTVESERRRDRGIIIERTDRLAHHMNEFVSQLPASEGIGGLVSIDRDDFSFFVGRERWDSALGNERRVLFLLAYHYGYLRLVTESDIPHPGLVVLDNPFQQDVDPALVLHGMRLLGRCCEENQNLQVVVATRRSLDEISAHRVYFTNKFNPEPH